MATTRKARAPRLHVPFRPTSVRRGKIMLAVVRRYQREGNWPEPYARRVGRLVIQGGITESGLRQLANPKVKGSIEFENDGRGEDGFSVGPLQQQVPMWGDVRHCQDTANSTVQFLDRLLPISMANGTGAAQIQKVQVSAFPDGSNYRRQYLPALTFMALYWSGTAPAKKARKK